VAFLHSFENSASIRSNFSAISTASRRTNAAAMTTEFTCEQYEILLLKHETNARSLIQGSACKQFTTESRIMSIVTNLLSKQDTQRHVNTELQQKNLTVNVRVVKIKITDHCISFCKPVVKFFSETLMTRCSDLSEVTVWFVGST
jgi:hypothetical protein